MRRTNGAVRVGGTWLAIASALMIAVLALHGPIAPDHNVQMTRIADGSTVWSVAHWIAAAAFSLYTVAGLVVLTSEARLTEGWWTMTAWAVLARRRPLDVDDGSGGGDGGGQCSSIRKQRGI